MNIFEGSRRIAKVAAGLWTVGFAAAAIYIEPNVSAKLDIYSPVSMPILTEIDCPDDSAKEFFQAHTKNGNKVYVTLCFHAANGFPGTNERLVPFAVDTKTNLISANERFSREVTRYTSAYAKSFVIPEKDEAALDSKSRAERWAQIRDGAKLMFGGLMALLTFTWIVGYVARGFMGIPIGQDTKPASEMEQS